MVQNRSNQPGVEHYSDPSFLFAKTRVRRNSQPIRPLKLPTFPKPLPPTEPVSPGSKREPGFDEPLPLNPPPWQQVDRSSLEWEDLEDSRIWDMPAPPDSALSYPNTDLVQTGLALEMAAAETSQAIASKQQSRKTISLAKQADYIHQNARMLSQRLAHGVSGTASGMYQTVLPKLTQPFTYVKSHAAELRWWIISLSILGSVSGITGLAFLWLASPPPSADCKKVTVSSPEVQRFYCAQAIAQSRELPDLLTGLKLVENWSPNQPLYHDAQQAIAQWSELLLVIARSKIAESDLEGAIAAAQQVPETSPVYTKAQEAIAAWQQEWKEGAAILEIAQTAIKAQDWKKASEQVAELGYFDHEYWRIQQADVLFKQIVREKQARQSLTQAQKLAKENDPTKLGEAIVLLQQVAPNTQAAPEAEIARHEWSQVLITFALKAWQQGDSNRAFNIAAKIPLDSSLPMQGQDLIRLSQADQLAKDALSTQSPTPDFSQLWQLWEAIAAVQAIAPESPFYPEAEAAVQTWTTQLEDLTQMSWASFFAGFGNRAALRLAVTQAEQITPDRPRHAQAETLVVQWQQQVDSLIDQPYLARAQRWAAAGKIPDLKAAIAQASEIPQHRAAWQQAQTLIAQWTAQIQTIEDQPIWDRAQKLAKQGKLSEAISVAAKIRPNRALYAQAQAGIANWKAQIQAVQIAEDQAILDRAYSLAASQRLTMAVDAASQITPDRPLYAQAQSLIEAWLDERNAIWKTWSEEPAPDNSSGTSLSSPNSDEGYYDQQQDDSPGE
ncbi:MAG: hypothetical protein Kow00121_53080 [Elainellaceae cyanobacterium]